MICSGAARAAGLDGGSDDFYGVPDQHGNAAPTKAKRGRVLVLTSGGWRRGLLATSAGAGEMHASGCEVESHREEVEREEDKAESRHHGLWLGRWG